MKLISTVRAEMELFQYTLPTIMDGGIFAGRPSKIKKDKSRAKKKRTKTHKRQGRQ